MRNFLRINFTLMAILLINIAIAQERTVTGKVTASDDGSPIPGVNVVVKGTTTGTVTDFDGNYKLSVPVDGGILEFRFIGLRTVEENIGNRSIIDVAMAYETTQLSEIVVTAVGIQREARALGYSVEQIKSDEVAQVSEPDVLRALQGKVPGVNISGSRSAGKCNTDYNSGKFILARE